MRADPTPETTVEMAWPPARYWIRIAAAVIGMVVALNLLLRLQGVLLVVVASFVLALGLQPALTGLGRVGLERWQAMGVVLLGGLAVAGAAAGAIVPVLVGQIDEIAASIPTLLDDLRASGGPIGDFVDRIDWAVVVDGAGTGLLGSVSGMAGAVFNVITVLILTPYFAYYFPAIKRYGLRLLRREDRPEFLRMVNESVDRISGYILGNFIVSVIAVAVSFVALWLLGIRFPLALAFWIGITDLIPVVGVFLGAAPVVALAALDGTGTVIAAIAFIVVYQQIENYLIGPRVMKRAVDLSPPSVILALMIGGSLAGFLGALLALPVAALVKIVFHDYVVARRIADVRASVTERAAGNGRGRPRDPGSLVRPLP